MMGTLALAIAAVCGIVGLLPLVLDWLASKDSAVEPVDAVLATQAVVERTGGTDGE